MVRQPLSIFNFQFPSNFQFSIHKISLLSFQVGKFVGGMELKPGDIFHDARDFLLVGVLPEGVTGIGETETVGDDDHMVGGITLQTEVFVIGLLRGHDDGFTAIGLLHELQEHIKTFHIDIERAVWYYINHRCKVKMISLDSSLKVVELPLCRIVAVV